MTNFRDKKGQPHEYGLNDHLCCSAYHAFLGCKIALASTGKLVLGVVSFGKVLQRHRHWDGISTRTVLKQYKLMTPSGYAEG